MRDELSAANEMAGSKLKDTGKDGISVCILTQEIYSSPDHLVFPSTSLLGSRCCYLSCAHIQPGRATPGTPKQSADGLSWESEQRDIAPLPSPRGAFAASASPISHDVSITSKDSWLGRPGATWPLSTQ
jgi:hypothetical protein